MIYPTQVTRLRDFFERFLEAYVRHSPGDIRLTCSTVKEIVREAEKLLDMLVVEAAQPPRKDVKVCVFSEIT